MISLDPHGFFLSLGSIRVSSVVILNLFMSIFISPLQQQNHTRKLKYNKLTYTIHPVMQKKEKKHTINKTVQLMTVEQHASMFLSC